LIRSISEVKSSLKCILEGERNFDTLVLTVGVYKILHDMHRQKIKLIDIFLKENYAAIMDFKKNIILSFLFVSFAFGEEVGCKSSSEKDNIQGLKNFLELVSQIDELQIDVASYLLCHSEILESIKYEVKYKSELVAVRELQNQFVKNILHYPFKGVYNLALGSKTESEKHLESAVEDFLWATTEVFIGIVRIQTGNPVDGAMAIADGIRNYKNAYDEFQEAIEGKEKENQND